MMDCRECGAHSGKLVKARKAAPNENQRRMGTMKYVLMMNTMRAGQEVPE